MLRLMRWTAAPAVALMFLTTAPSAEPQVQATAVMKSGARHTGVNAWYRTDKGEFALRKSQSEELRVPADQVAYVDFGGSADVNPNISGSQAAVVLRNGTVVRGQLIELGHTDLADITTPFFVIFRDENGQEQRYPAAQVARVYFPGGAPSTATSGTSTPATGATTGSGLVVSGRQQWTPTGINVRRGDVLTFNTTGQVRLSATAEDVAGPNGSTSGRYANNAPMPRVLAGALIGRVGNGQPFAIGDQQSVTMLASGQLFLGINDDGMDDNAGEFRVEVRRTGRR